MAANSKFVLLDVNDYWRALERTSEDEGGLLEREGAVHSTRRYLFFQVIIDVILELDGGFVRREDNVLF